jgi:hypothetical protein
MLAPGQPQAFLAPTRPKPGFRPTPSPGVKPYFEIEENLGLSLNLSRPLARFTLSLLIVAAAARAPAALAQTPAPVPDPASATLPPAVLPDDPSTGAITGTVVARDGSVYEGVHVTLKPALDSPHPPAAIVMLTDNVGSYRFSAVPPGPFEITITSSGFAPQTRTGTLTPGNTYQVPAVTFTFADATSEVEVTASRAEIATEQLHIEEEQRVLGIIPNFYVVYTPNAVPLNTRQKFHLFWRTQIDPVTIAAAAFTAGYQQADDDFSGYGQGAQGYFKRFGADYADSFIGNAIGGAILPSLLHQDPRYFYLGHGTIRHRTLYAIANAVICKGDNGRWQPNYSSIGGSFAAGGISNLYYPARDRNGVSLTFENAALGMAGGAIGNIFQEFVVPRLTPHLPKYGSQPKPPNP